MKIAFIVEHLDPNRGGMERSAVDFLTELSGLGAEVHVVTQTSAWSFPGIHVHLLGAAGWTDERRYKNFVIRAQEFVTSHRWDVVHAIRPCVACDVYQPRGGLIKAGQERTIARRRNGFARFMRQAALFFNGKERLLVSLEHQLLDESLRRWSSSSPANMSKAVRTALLRVRRIGQASLQRRAGGASAQADRGEARHRLRRELSLPVDQLVAIFVGHNFRRKGLARIIESSANRPLDPGISWSWDGEPSRSLRALCPSTWRRWNECSFSEAERTSPNSI